MPRGSSSSSGRVPKRDSTRRRANKPKSYGDANPTTGMAASPEDRPRELGIVDVEPEIQALWDEIQHSAEAKFYSRGDWVRVRLELTYGNEVLQELRYGCQIVLKDGGITLQKKVNAQAWKTFQDAMTELLISPAAKRRAGIELKPPDEGKAAELDAKIVELSSRLQA